MRQIFLVLGYGIPKDIFKDGNYDRYLRLVFNAIFDWCARHARWDPMIVFSGGNSDMFKPYRRTEGTEMLRLFRSFVERPSVKDKTSKWGFVVETRSQSSLDNFLRTKELLLKKHLPTKGLIVFGEQTRLARLKKNAKAVFGNATIHPVDFDQSSNRYLDPTFLQEKEQQALKIDRWALKSPENLKKHRALFKRKMEILHQAGPKQHQEALQAWWQQQLEQLHKTIPTR